MISDLMKNYMDFLFKFHISESLLKESAIMVYDSFQDHLKKSVKIKFK